MPNKILTATGWQERIRTKFRLTSNQLPDADIQQPDIISMAEAMVTDAVPAWASILAADPATNKNIYLESAVVNACCALLCPSMSQRLPKNTKGPHMTIDYGDIDWVKKESDLWTDFRSDVGRCNQPTDGTIVSAVPFSVSGPTRAGVTWWN